MYQDGDYAKLKELEGTNRKRKRELLRVNGWYYKFYYDGNIWFCYKVYKDGREELYKSSWKTK